MRREAAWLRVTKITSTQEIKYFNIALAFRMEGLLLKFANFFNKSQSDLAKTMVFLWTTAGYDITTYSLSSS
jgi:uncharacterized membrane protein YjfL (UPF0719 family)